MPPTATHQQDNSYGGSAIWRVSKFVIPLIYVVIYNITEGCEYIGRSQFQTIRFYGQSSAIFHGVVVWHLEKEPKYVVVYDKPVCVCRSVNEVICHGIPDMRPLEDGDICNGENIVIPLVHLL